MMYTLEIGKNLKDVLAGLLILWAFIQLITIFIVGRKMR